MVRRFKSVEQFQRAMFKRPMELMRFNVSPGWVSACLEVSRSRVSQMINEGVLDAVKTDDGYVLLRKAEVLSFKRFRDLVPKRQHAVMGRAWKSGKEQREPRVRAREDALFSKFRVSVTFPESSDAATSK